MEQEKFKTMLKKVIHDTETHHIQSSQEMIQTLIDELTHERLLPNVQQSVLKSK
ncbi:translation elongation factor Ts [Oceanobacillus picturae]|jgi:hypothetical protein|uniref:Translation elongation factor Ts n=2 Tax=Oceanobacillus TaxID=182709 RepID=W9B9V1_9BACI|nr:MULTISPECIES: hypothetical protein [Oceanobacillus]MCG3420587.1 hypothetical protein [Oceanobacillus jordanicus]GAQ19195.1 translation elongation factor Ts [Oceanobacillus picturae]CDO03275.1 hypothetical protein BN988_01780 [Oceanobacillus picturae]